MFFRFIRNRSKYWSCSKFADFIRGTKKPSALEWKEWEKWHKETKNKSPIRYWLAEEFLKKLQNFFYFPCDIYKSIHSYYRNRFVDKTHCLKTGLRPGGYYELDERILYGLFNELKEFVECDLAHTNSFCSKNKKYKFKKGRCPESGIDYLKWASKLKQKNKLTPQATASRQILKLYQWWENRPNRPDPADVSGWSKHCEESKLESDDILFDHNRSDQSKKILQKMQKIEDKYEKEDENMLTELIKIRKHLWI